MTPRWRHLALNPKTDVLLCQSPRHSPDSSNQVTQGTDLFAHKALNGVLHYYLRHWSLKQGESNICELISQGTAREFILECSIQTRDGGITDSELNRILGYFPSIFNEET